MKKLKWILLFIMILLSAVFLFATCKKTNALTGGENYGESIYIDNTGENNSNFVGVYLPTYTESSDVYYMISDYGGSDYLIYCTTYNQSTGITYSFINYGGTRLLTTSNYQNKEVLAVVINIGTYISNDAPLCINIQIIKVNDSLLTSGGVAYLDQDNYYLYLEEQQNAQDYSTFVNAYNSQTGLKLTYLYNGTPGRYTGLYNVFTYDYLDYNESSWSEMVDTAYDNYTSKVIKDFSVLYNTAYNLGNIRGYQEGYDDGETYGYNQGYNTGVSDNAAGQQQAYDRGYDDGIRDGYLPAYNSGYTRGYSDGEAAGLAGATPVSQTVTLIGSIFGAIGTVLSIQLFPGFSLGILILVPLFFAVLGLILWIWRRN